MASKLEEASQNGGCALVEMDDIKFRRFRSGGPGSLGTMNLNGGTAIAIVSEAGAILAHIMPRLAFDNPKKATGDDHVMEMMTKVQHFLNMRRTAFIDRGTYSVVIYGMYEGEVALPDQLQIISDGLESWGITAKYVSYEVTPAYQRGPAAGTVLVDGRYEQAALYVEDVRVA